MSRQDHIDFDRNYCTHYDPHRTPRPKDYCALGCNASDRMKDAHEAGEPNMTPCIGGHTAANVLALCPKWERRSLEHAEKRADSIEKMFRRMDVVGPVVAKWRTWTERLPDVIRITIAEEDRQNADHFIENCSCLLATTIKRQLGARHVVESVDNVTIDGVKYRHRKFAPRHYGFTHGKPYYPPSVVGRVVKLTRSK